MRSVGLPRDDHSEDLTNINVLERFPQITGGTLDRSQMEAVKRILTKVYYSSLLQNTMANIVLEGSYCAGPTGNWYVASPHP